MPGDGIGPEVVGAGVQLLDALAPRFDAGLEIEQAPVGGVSIDEHGVPLLPEVLDRCRSADAVLLGAVGGPKWDSTDPAAPRPEQGLLGLRKGLGLFANLRPVRVVPALASASPLREERARGADILIVRELTGGIYFGDRGRSDGVAHDTCIYSVEEVERIAELAFRLAGTESRGGRVTSVDKANILETSRLWRETVEQVAAGHPEVQLEHMLVDNAAMQLIARPTDFDVLLTENMFGDILSDEAAMVAGSIGLLASASIGSDGPGLYEPVHGSAPDIAGKGVANPLAMFGSIALMLRHSFEMEESAASVESAVDRVLERGLRTPDLAAGSAEETRVGTAAMTQAVIDELGAPSGGA
ncbi:MAG TPA: 3-isopropylmalate dehydrogenase [Solirubrobacterales bacterium]|nr:3-isopropylmalate dehydrogenase [Solirubrobacterales bacterium]